MCDQDHDTLSGPDFLHAVADAEIACGKPVNAEIYRRRARNWTDDLRELSDLRARVRDLEARLADISRQAQAA